MSKSENKKGHSDLDHFDQTTSDRPPFLLTYGEVKLLAIAGIGFFLDAYDLFVINPVSTMLQFRLYGGHSIPPGIQGVLKASANIGSVIGQFSFGYLADAVGRKAVYGKELMLIIFATIMSITTPTGQLTPNNAIIYLTIWRIILGIGVGADYPLSATVTSDRANLRKRGTMLAYIFSNQGWGSLVGSLVTIIVLLCYKHVMKDEGHTSKVDGAWRIVIGLSLIPAAATLYQRLHMPESKRYEATKKASDGVAAMEILEELKKEKMGHDLEVKPVASATNSVDEQKAGEDVARVPISTEELKKPAHFGEFLAHFSKWRNAKLLIGTSMTWFLLDIAFYGINLNQNVVLQQIGFDGKTGSDWDKIFKIATGNIIITVLGFVPGYYVSILTIEKLGRKFIQLQGFVMTSLFLAILAGKFNTLKNDHAAFIVLFALLQFFFNFGANTTTYCYPAELFPTRYRAFAHGISAASGKVGAIISALAFNTLSQKVGTPIVLWIFFGCNILGFFFTLLLPEVKGRDPDLILAQELLAEREAEKAAHGVA